MFSDAEIDSVQKVISGHTEWKAFHAEFIAHAAIRMYQKTDEYKSLLADASRLDYVELQSNGDLWAARNSSTGRGYRLHNDSVYGFHTAREAIDAARAGQGDRNMSDRDLFRNPPGVSHCLQNEQEYR